MMKKQEENTSFLPYKALKKEAILSISTFRKSDLGIREDSCHFRSNLTTRVLS